MDRPADVLRINIESMPIPLPAVTAVFGVDMFAEVCLMAVLDALRTANEVLPAS